VKKLLRRQVAWPLLGSRGAVIKPVGASRAVWTDDRRWPLAGPRVLRIGLSMFWFSTSPSVCGKVWLLNRLRPCGFSALAGVSPKVAAHKPKASSVERTTVAVQRI
jgi:hypothetical protein